MTLDELRATLVGWLEKVKTWYDSSGQDWNDYILTDREWHDYLYPPDRPSGRDMVWKPRDNQLHLVIFTNDHRYHVSLSVKDNGRTYMGCIAQTRKPRAGENWERGNDLHDGPFTWDDFVAIMLDIAAYEMVAKVKK